MHKVIWFILLYLKNLKYFLRLTQHGSSQVFPAIEFEGSQQLSSITPILETTEDNQVPNLIDRHSGLTFVNI